MRKADLPDKCHQLGLETILQKKSLVSNLLEKPLYFHLEFFEWNLFFRKKKKILQNVSIFQKH